MKRITVPINESIYLEIDSYNIAVCKVTSVSQKGTESRKKHFYGNMKDALTGLHKHYFMDSCSDNENLELGDFLARWERCKEELVEDAKRIFGKDGLPCERIANYITGDSNDIYERCDDEDE